jgi:hypothetical protein
VSGKNGAMQSRFILFLAVILLLTIGAAGCAHYPTNERLEKYDPDYGYRGKNMRDPARGGSTPEYREMTIKRLIPLGRFTTMEEIGEAVSFLASDRAATITGQMLAVTGAFDNDRRYDTVIDRRFRGRSPIPREVRT